MVLVHYEQFLIQSQVAVFQADRTYTTQCVVHVTESVMVLLMSLGDTLKPYFLFALACSAVAQVPEIAYDAVPNFLKLPPDLYLGEVSGVAVNSKKHIFVL